MIDFLKLFVHIVVSPFKTRARLEAEIVLLRHQLNVLHRRVPSKPTRSYIVVIMLFSAWRLSSMAKSASIWQRPPEQATML